MSAIEIWNRAQGKLETELVYGDFAMRLAYGSFVGRFFLDHLLTKRWFSRAYGALESSPLSRRKIPRFIKQFGIPMQEYEEKEFLHFNDFFTRKFRPTARPFESEEKRMPAFCEGRYLAYAALPEGGTLPVKNFSLRAADLLNDGTWTATFKGGPALIARLCPVDYHRFHFPDSGRKIARFAASGALHSVNPLALSARPEALFTNERQITILETNNFGKLAYVEVGALMVGKIVESHDGVEFSRGQEKGYFLFGGSTVIVLFQPGKIVIDPDLLAISARGTETLVKLGEGIATRI